MSSRFWMTLVNSLTCFSVCSRRRLKDSISPELLGTATMPAAGDPVNFGEAALGSPRTRADLSIIAKLSVSGRILVGGNIIEERADVSGLVASDCDDCGTPETGSLMPRASSIRSSRSVSTRPFDGNTRYPDCKGFGSVYHAVILAVTRTRVSSWPFAATWTAHS